MNIPEGLLYSKDHEWLKIEGGTALVGITDYAQDALGDIVYVELPQTGKVEAGQRVCTIESVKAVSDVLTPASGTIVAVNDELESSPEQLNEDAFSMWIFKIDDFQPAADMMDSRAYEQFLSEEGAV